jgi:flagellar basal body rod protein FlgG
MNSISSVAVSGIHTSLLALTAAANNVANAQTSGFRRQVVLTQEQRGGGVTAFVGQSRAMQDPTAALADDIVQQMFTGYLYRANVLTLRIEQKMLGSLLDIQA